MNTVVGISESHVSSDPRVTLSTYSLGSCIGVALFDPVVGVGGMLHFQLPSATLDPARGRVEPAMFADTGMSLLLTQLASLGAVERRMRVTVAGAAQMLNDSTMFNIGRRNHAAIRKLLWQRGLLIDKEDVGGSLPRNLYLRIGDGTAAIKVLGTAGVVARAA